MPDPVRLIDRYTRIWRELGLYERIEQMAAIFLTILISIIAFYACLRVLVSVYDLVVFKDDLMDPAVFLNLFGMILTVLIALEFNHSIIQVLERKQSIVQVRIVVQIAILAVVRKVILLDLDTIDAPTLVGLGAVIVALAALYWVIRTEGGVRWSAPRRAPAPGVDPDG